jgi:hypothetical protein
MPMKDVTVFFRGNGIFSSRCEMLDGSDLETKIFRFADGCKWGMMHDGPRPGPADVRVVTVYSSWGLENSQREGRYRVTAVLDPQPGYIAVLEGTTKPVVEVEVRADESAMRCELAIMAALEKQPRLSLRELRRKISAHRFAAFDASLKKLADAGEITIETKRGLTNNERTWIALSADNSGSAASDSTSAVSSDAE